MPKRHAFLALLLEALCAQTVAIADLVWIVVENGEDAPCPEVAEVLSTFRKKGGRTVHEVMSGRHPIGAVRNRLLEAGLAYTPAIEIFVQCDDDDYYYPDRCKHAIQTLTRQKADLVGCTYTQLCDVQLGVFRLGPYGPNHGLANSMAFTRQYATNHRYDASKWNAEETSFTDSFTQRMVQLDPYKVCIQFVHANTFNKRKLLLTLDEPSSKTQVLVGTTLAKLLGKHKRLGQRYEVAVDGALRARDASLPFAACEIALYFGMLGFSPEQFAPVVGWINANWRNDPTTPLIAFCHFKDNDHCQYDETKHIWWVDVSLLSFVRLYKQLVLVGFAGQWPIVGWTNTLSNATEELVCDCRFGPPRFTDAWVDAMEKLPNARLLLSESAREALVAHSPKGGALVTRATPPS